MSIKGIDVSSHQHPDSTAVDFSKVTDAGFKFVSVKATEGVGYTNPFLVQDVAAARQAGLAVGVYVFLHADGNGVGQANKLLEAIHGLKLDLPVGLDIETPGGHAHQVLDQARTVIRQHGYLTMTYSYAPYLEQHIPADCRFCASDPLWLAGYSAKQPAAPKPWSKVTIWQNSDKGNVPGVPSNTDDTNVFLGDAQAFSEFIGHRQAKPTAPPDWYHRLLSFPVSTLRNPGQTVIRAGKRYQEGDDVKAVQRKIGVRPDGLYGPVTAAHVKGFQRLHNLNPDGVVGPQTAKRLH